MRIDTLVAAPLVETHLVTDYSTTSTYSRMYMYTATIEQQIHHIDFGDANQLQAFTVCHTDLSWGGEGFHRDGVRADVCDPPRYVTLRGVRSPHLLPVIHRLRPTLNRKRYMIKHKKLMRATVQKSHIQ